jgi:hypothetical protein
MQVEDLSRALGRANARKRVNGNLIPIIVEKYFHHEAQHKHTKNKLDELIIVHPETPMILSNIPSSII